MRYLNPNQNISNLERAVTAGLAGFALARYGGRSLFGTALAAALLHRAATGHCSLYQAAGIDTSVPSMPLLQRSSIQLSKSIVINAGPERIYPLFSTRLEKLAQLSPEVLKLEKIDTDISRWTVRTPVGYHSFESRIVSRLENQQLSWECNDTKFPHRGQVILTPEARGTVVRVSMDYHVPGGAVSAQLARVSGHEPHEALERTLFNLRSLLETGEIPRSVTHPNPSLAGKETTR